MACVIHPIESRSFSFLFPDLRGKQTHPTVSTFMQLNTEQIINRHCKKHKDVDPDSLLKLLTYQPKHFRWAGADLFPCLTSTGSREMVVLEVNSCPSGQKYMPHGTGKDSGYHKLIGDTFRNVVFSKCQAELHNASLAVLQDKNLLENSGYATALADLTKEPVYMVKCNMNMAPEHQQLRWMDGVMEVKDKEGQWHAIRAAFRYVTQKPWTRIPVTTKTVVFNPIACCLSGGRNKLLAVHAYEDFNKQEGGRGLRIRFPRTIMRVTKDQIPKVVNDLHGKAVIKIPYSNGGQGVYTVTSKKELDALMAQDLGYEKFIVQTLIGHKKWSSSQWYHACTLPDEEGQQYVFDTRMMIHATQDGLRPLCIFSRRARLPLKDTLDGTKSSWEYLGTNLSFKDTIGDWQTATERVLTADSENFETLGLSVEDLIDGFVQAVMATIAIDSMCCRLVCPDMSFDFEEFAMLVDDPKLHEEILDVIRYDAPWE